MKTAKLFWSVSVYLATWVYIVGLAITGSFSWMWALDGHHQVMLALFLSLFSILVTAAVEQTYD